MKQLLRAAEREGRDDDVALASTKCVLDDEHQFVDGLAQRPVQPVAVGGFDHQHISRVDGRGVAHDRSSGLPEVA